MSRKYWKFTRVNLSVTTLVFFMTKNVNDIGKWAIVWIRLVEKRQRLGEVIDDRVLKMQHRWCIWPLWTISFIKCLTYKLSAKFFFSSLLELTFHLYPCYFSWQKTLLFWDIGKWAIVWIQFVKKLHRLGKVFDDPELKMQQW